MYFVGKVLNLSRQKQKNKKPNKKTPTKQTNKTYSNNKQATKQTKQNKNNSKNPPLKKSIILAFAPTCLLTEQQTRSVGLVL